MLTALLIIVILIIVGLVAIAFLAIAIYNALVSQRNYVSEGWSGIDVQLRRRFNLVGNLVSTVKGYAKHEAETLAEVTNATQVKFHQDFPFQPMSNDDIITCLLFLDDVTLENGPLEVVPGSHRGPLYSHWHGGRFTGAVADELTAEVAPKAVPCTGKAGSVCLMHSSLLHGSAPNLSDGPRTLYITTYYAEDAVELSPNALPSTLTHELVRGEVTGRIRCSSYEMLRPEIPEDTSFFAQQETAGA